MGMMIKKIVNMNNYHCNLIEKYLKVTYGLHHIQYKFVQIGKCEFWGILVTLTLEKFFQNQIIPKL